MEQEFAKEDYSQGWNDAVEACSDESIAWVQWLAEVIANIAEAT